MAVANALSASVDETLNPLPELTTRMRETQFYVPDLAIEDLAKPIQGRYPGPNDPVLLCVDLERKTAREYFPEDLEPRRVQDNLTAGPVVLGLGEVFRRV